MDLEESGVVIMAAIITTCLHTTQAEIQEWHPDPDLQITGIEYCAGNVFRRRKNNETISFSYDVLVDSLCSRM